MSLKNEILELLSANPNTYISGEDLAVKFNKSRAAVWKAVKALQADGFDIKAVTNKGYCFDGDNDVLNKSGIEGALDFPCEVFCYDSIDSTNNQAKRLVSEGNTSTLLVVADTQTAGRGRQGKSFYSPAKTGIYMTLVLHPMTEMENAVTATTAAAVAVCRAIESLTDKHPQIKWVNDVYIADKKICGILTEAVTDFETQTVTSLIIGIGTNIKTDIFPADVKNASSLNAEVKRRDLICAIANELNRINSSPYSDFIEYYREHSMITGRDINVIKNGECIRARAVAIDDRGGLEVVFENGEKAVLRSGEITIRAI